MFHLPIWRHLFIPALLLAVLLPPRQHAFAQPRAWAQVKGVPAAADLHTVFMLDRTLAWAVGSDGQGGGGVYRLHLQNGRWVVALEASFTQGPLRALAVVSPTNIWAVGENGLIVQKDANGWRTIPTPLPAASLTTIQMFGSGEEGWVGGSLPRNGSDTHETVLLHYQDGRWQRDTTVPGRGAIQALHFVDGVGWAVGEGIWRYSDGRWTQEPAPLACEGGCVWSLAGVRAINADEAWAVGERMGICAVCAPGYYVVHRSDNQWRVVLSGTGVVNEPPRTVPAVVHQEWTNLTAVSFTADGHGVAVGNRGAPPADPVSRQLVVRYHDGQWVYEPTPTTDGGLLGVSMADTEHGLAVGTHGLILSYGYGPQSVPTPEAFAPAGNPNHPGVAYFDVVAHTLRGEFRSYWESNGGLPVFGYPLSEEFSERNLDLEADFTTQYFERERFEWHPDQSPPYRVLLGRLGAELLQAQNRNWRDEDDTGNPFPGSACQTFVIEAERRAVCGPFLGYWQTHGLEFDGRSGTTYAESLALLGLPLSAPKLETNPDGQRVVTQWFERARLEYHPTNPAPYDVLLGRLGSEVVNGRGIQVP